MSKRIDELTTEEGQRAIDNLTLGNQRIELDKIELRKKRDRLNDEKKRIGNEKSKNLKSIQEDINKSRTKQQKESKRRKKKLEAEKFDRRIKAKNSEIVRMRERITELDKQKAMNNAHKTRIRQHLKNLKN